MLAWPILAVAATFPAHAETARQQWKWCEDDKADPDLRVRSCSARIQSGQETKKNLALAHFNRGNAYGAKGDQDRAIADYTEAIRLDPKDDRSYALRGRLYLYRGKFSNALADFNQASELDPQDAYNALWLDITGHRNALPSRLPQAISKLDMTKWPAPVVRMYLGQLTPDAVLAAADNPDVNKKRGQVCEANFFSGEMELRRGDKAAAVRLFRFAADHCQRTYVEWWAARAELNALGEGP